MRRSCTALSIAMAAMVAGDARADSADDAFADAVAAEGRLELRRAADGYRAALRERPSAAFALRARARLDDLEAHSEGDYAPLAALLRVRRDPALASSAEELSALLRLSETFPPGMVLRETWLLTAEGLTRRAGRPNEGLAPAQKLLSDAAAPLVMRAAALSVAVAAKEALGDRAGAAAIARAHRALAPAIAGRFDREERRARLRHVAVGALGLVAAAGVWGLVRGARAAVRPGARVLTFVLVAALSTLVLRLYDPTASPRPFLLLSLGALLVERAISVARSAGAPRVGLLALGMGAVLAVAYLSLSGGDVDLLGEFGL